MMITHDRNHDQEAVQGSERVQCRSLALIKSLESIAVNEKVQLMYHSLDTHTGEYQDFLERYGYDEPQKAVMKKILLTLLTNQK